MHTPQSLTWKAVAYVVILFLLLAVQALSWFGFPVYGAQEVLEQLRTTFEDNHIFEIISQLIDIIVEFLRKLRDRF